MRAEIHGLVAAGDQAATRATYRGTGRGGFIPAMPATGKTFAMDAIYLVRVSEQGQIAEHWAWPTVSAPWASQACCPPPARRPTALIGAYSRPGTHAGLASNDREFIVLRQAKGSCRYSVAASAAAPGTPGRTSRRQGGIPVPAPNGPACQAVPGACAGTIISGSQIPARSSGCGLAVLRTGRHAQGRPWAPASA
jgi:hypothetical protein